jgi:hypothetical protein
MIDLQMKNFELALKADISNVEMTLKADIANVGKNMANVEKTGCRIRWICWSLRWKKDSFVIYFVWCFIIVSVGEKLLPFIDHMFSK